MAEKQYNLADLPGEMFTIIKPASPSVGPRLGRLSFARRNNVETPHYLALTSRGIVPHLTQDTFARDTSISGVYVGLEDFERAPYRVPPLYRFRPSDGSSPLRRFMALSNTSLLVMGARRTPPVAAPAANPNTNTTVSICTSVGFRPLNADDYAEAAENLKADIVVGLGDIPYGRAFGSKRIEKATDRNIQWMQDHVKLRRTKRPLAEQAKLFAPILPATCSHQQFYLDCLIQELSSEVAGLAIYDLSSLEDFPEALQSLPRLGFTAPNTPHEVLRHIALGIDLLTVPFLNHATDAGIALDFSFPPPIDQTNNHPQRSLTALGLDMWSADHATDLSPLGKCCGCYTCTTHHKAYVQHLLVAKEMLGWVLLQIHNHHVLDQFFDAIRKSIASGKFESDTESFQRAYESTLPERTGQGPRVRGYQFKSEGPGEPKKNKPPFVMLDEGEEKVAEFMLPSDDADTDDLDILGIAENRS